MSHTPGPWRYEPPLIVAPALRVEDKCAEVCEILDDPESQIHSQHTKADARLIAAAPTLLEALNDLLCGAQLFVAEHNMALTAKLAADLDKARAAIEKAQSGESE